METEAARLHDALLAICAPLTPPLGNTAVSLITQVLFIKLRPFVGSWKGILGASHNRSPKTTLPNAVHKYFTFRI